MRETRFDELIEGLLDQQWGTSQTIVQAPLLEAPREEASALLAQKEMKEAGIGKQKQHERAIRQTYIKWFDPDALSPTEAALWSLLDELRQALCEQCYLSLSSFECHYAIYPVGAFYQRHKDQFHKDSARLLSFILYLNPGWSPQEGGALRLYLPTEGGEEQVDIIPEDGTFALFRSDALEHEVMLTQRERVCVVGWMKTRSSGLSF